MIFFLHFLILPFFAHSLSPLPPSPQNIFKIIKYHRSGLPLSFSEKKRNSAPIIGILTQPSSWVSLYDAKDFSYIAASYVKALEAAGAQVIPIKYDWDDEKIKEVMEGLNGLLLPGGGTELVLEESDRISLTDYAVAGKKLLKMAIEINDNGIHFPVWGTCLGFELMILAITEDLRVLEKGFLSLNYSNTISFLEESKESRLFKDMNNEWKGVLESQKLIYFNHKYALDINVFMDNKELKSFYKALTVSYDKNNKAFVSTIEAIKYPFYGVQYHPEKNAYEWKNHLEIDHSFTAVQIMRYYMDFFVKEAKNNERSFTRKNLAKELLIYNFYPLQMSDAFQLVYIFSNWDKKDYFKTVPTHTSLIKFLSSAENLVLGRNETLANFKTKEEDPIQKEQKIGFLKKNK